MEQSTEPDNRFRNEYLGMSLEFPPLEKALVELWRTYYREAEIYDRSVCTGPIGRSGIMPAAMEERMLITHNSRRLNDRLMQEASKLKATKADIRLAKKRASRMPVDLNQNEENKQH